MISVEEYITEEGNSPFADWFDNLDAHAANKVNTYDPYRRGKYIEPQAA